MPFNKTKNSYLDLCQFIKYRVQFFEENWNLKLKALNPVSLLKYIKKKYIPSIGAKNDPTALYITYPGSELKKYC